jgi:hypothetical protein
MARWPAEIAEAKQSLWIARPSLASSPERPWFRPQVERHEIPRTRVIGELSIEGRLKNRPNEGIDVSCILDRRQFCHVILLAVDADVLNLFRDID